MLALQGTCRMKTRIEALAWIAVATSMQHLAMHTARLVQLDQLHLSTKTVATSAQPRNMLKQDLQDAGRAWLVAFLTKTVRVAYNA